MNDTSRSLRRSVGLAAVVAICLAGCGTSESPTVAKKPAVDPRYASADAILEHINSLNSQTPDYFPAYVAIIYAENDFQARFLKLMRASVPSYQLLIAAQKRFDEPLYPEPPDIYGFKSSGVARIVERSERRAKATYAAGTSSDLYLVEIGGRWWLSAYTLEYDPNFKLTPEGMQAAETALGPMAEMAQDLLRRLDAGEFESIAALRNGIADAAMAYMSQHPEAFGGLAPPQEEAQSRTLTGSK